MDVSIRQLPAMRVAAVRAFGEAPEREAWEKLRAWPGPQQTVFGFNSPPPASGTTEYGYELWVEAGPDCTTRPGFDLKDFPGGRYAVTACRLDGIGPAWRALWEWVKASEYRWRRAQELEHVLNPSAPEADMVVELYLPIEG